MFCKKRCFQKFCKIYRKHLCQSLFFDKFCKPQPATLLKMAQVFPCEFCKISKNTVFIEHFRETTSVNQYRPKSGSRNFSCFSRSSHPEVFLVKSVLKICNKFTGEHPYRSVISILKSHFGVVFCCKCAAYFENTFF